MGKVYLGNQEISPAVSVPVAKEKFGASIDTFIGDVNENGVLGKATKPTSLVFDGVKDIAGSACQHMFYGKANITDVSFPELTTISHTYACEYMFYMCHLTSASFPALTTISEYEVCGNMFTNCSYLTNISLPALTTISGSNTCISMFGNCSALTSISLPALTTISGSYTCTGMFSNCSKLTNISFPALTAADSNVFGPSYNYIFNGCNALTEIHFRADAQATIEAIAGYEAKWGAKNATIYFDL